MPRYALINPKDIYVGTGKLPILAEVLHQFGPEYGNHIVVRYIISANGIVINQKRQTYGYAAKDFHELEHLGITGKNLFDINPAYLFIKDRTPIKVAVEHLLKDKTSLEVALRRAKTYAMKYSALWRLDLPPQYGKILTMKTRAVVAARKKGKRK